MDAERLNVALNVLKEFYGASSDGEITTKVYGALSEAYEAGHRAGFEKGNEEGFDEGVENAYDPEEAQEAYRDGREDGYREGYRAGVEAGHDEGYEAGRRDATELGVPTVNIPMPDTYTPTYPDKWEDWYN